eukprot:PhF_6_TR12997/c0_g1_i4/m.20570
MGCATSKHHHQMNQTLTPQLQAAKFVPHLEMNHPPPPPPPPETTNNSSSQEQKVFPFTSFIPISHVAQGTATSFNTHSSGHSTGSFNVSVGCKNQNSHNESNTMDDDVVEELCPASTMQEATEAVKTAMEVTPLENIILAGISFSFILESSHNNYEYFGDDDAPNRQRKHEVFRRWIDTGEIEVRFDDPMATSDAWKVWKTIYARDGPPSGAAFDIRCQSELPMLQQQNQKHESQPSQPFTSSGVSRHDFSSSSSSSVLLASAASLDSSVS